MILKRGVFWWLVLRITALVLCVGIPYLIFSIAMIEPLNQPALRVLMTDQLVRWVALLVVVSMSFHGVIGIWGIATDYLTLRAGGRLGALLQGPVVLLSSLVALAWIVWAVRLLWEF